MNSQGGWGKRYLNRLERLISTILLYGVFGFGAVGVVLFVVSPIVLFSGDANSRAYRIRWVNHKSFKYFTRCGVVLGVFDVIFYDVKLIQKPGQLIIANHPSLLDVVFLIGQIPNVNCVVKKNLLRNPFLAMNVYFANYIRNDVPAELLERCVEKLELGESLIIFPEGTRTLRQQGYQFKRGAANIMLRANCAVRPVHISCTPATLGKGDSWYVVPEQKIVYRYTGLPELDLTHIRRSDLIRLPLKARRLTRWLADWYTQMEQSGAQSSSASVGLEQILEPKTPSCGI